MEFVASLSAIAPQRQCGFYLDGKLVAGLGEWRTYDRRWLVAAVIA